MKLTVSAMRRCRDGEETSQVLRMQLIHMQTRSDTYTRVQRESCGEEREAVSDGEGEEGQM